MKHARTLSTVFLIIGAAAQTVAAQTVAAQAGAATKPVAAEASASRAPAKQAAENQGRIEDLEAVLPAGVLGKLRKKSPNSNVGSLLVAEPVHFIVNAALSDPKQLAARLRRWSRDSGIQMSSAQHEALAASHHARGTRVASKLRDVAQQFLDRVFNQTRSNDTLRQLVNDPRRTNKVILFCFDLRGLWMRKIGSQHRLELDLSMRVFRVHLGPQPKGRKPREIKSILCLFQDHAIGVAPLGAGTDPDIVQRGIAVAAVDAIRYRIALNLLDNKRLATNWLKVDDLSPTTEGGRK